MSGVERVMYMDNIRTQALTETIGKEHSIHKKHFKQMEEEGKLPKPVTPLTQKQTMSELECTRMPEFFNTLMQDPEQKMLTRMSSSMYAASNPGYLLRDGLKTISVAKKDYVWDQEEWVGKVGVVAWTASDIADWRWPGRRWIGCARMASYIRRITCVRRTSRHTSRRAPSSAT